MSATEQNYNFDEEAPAQAEGAAAKPTQAESSEASGQQAKAVRRQSNGIAAKLKSSLHLIAIGAVVVGVGGYMVYSGWKTFDPPKQKPVASNNNAMQFNSDQMHPVNYAAAARPAVSARALKKTESHIDQSLASVQKQLVNNQKVIENQMVSIQHGLQGNNQLIAKLNQEAQLERGLVDQVGKIGQSLKQISTQVNQNTKTMQQMEKIVDAGNQRLALYFAAQNNAREKLTLRAIVSGRAWLVNKEGVVSTVTRGSEISGYGKVMRVDDQKDEVITSSGFIFK